MDYIYSSKHEPLYLNQTSKVILDKYKGDLDNLRKEAKHDPVRERELVKAFKVYMCVRGYVVTQSHCTIVDPFKRPQKGWF